MISVVIPVYNTGKKLNKCLKSLVNQTYKNWECFLVNDCSTDATTVCLLNNWGQKDKRFILINNSINLGIEKNRFVAINRILSEGKSEYLMFMDHDDWLYSENSLEYLYENAISSGADVTIGRHNEAFFLFQKAGYNPVPCGLITKPELKDKYYISYFGVNIIPVDIWARLYKVELVRKAKMKPHGLLYTDDNAWNLFIMPFANSIMMLDKVVYVHRWGGLSSRYSNSGLKEYKHFYKIRRQAIIDFDFPQGRFYLDCELKNVLAACIYNSIVKLNKSKSEIIEFLKNELKDNIWREVDESIKQRDDDFSIALIKRDYNRLYDIQYQKTKKPNTIIKTYIKTLFNLF